MLAVLSDHGFKMAKGYSKVPASLVSVGMCHGMHAAQYT